MRNNYFIGLYWESRKEGKEKCQQRIERTFDLLSKVDDSFKEWFKTTKPRKGIVQLPIQTDNAGVNKLLINSQNFNDTGLLLEDLGYLIYLKSEKDFSKAHILSITCGCLNPKIANSLIIDINQSKFRDESILINIFESLTEVWQPTRGLIRNNNEVLFELKLR